MAVAYNLPRLSGRALSLAILDGPVHLHTPGTAEQLGPLESTGAKRRHGGSHRPGQLSWCPGSINLDKMFLRNKVKRVEVENIRLC